MSSNKRILNLFHRTCVSVAAVLLLFQWGCSVDPEQSGAGQVESEITIPYTVVATTGMIGDIAVHVGGERVEVITLIGEGVDPHLYTPTRQDVLKLRDADVILYNGRQLEGRMSDVLTRMKRQGRFVMAVTETDAIGEDVLLPDEDDDYEYDPHLWMDVSLWSIVSAGVAEMLADFDQEGAAYYAENLKEYQNILGVLHQQVSDIIGSIPEERRILVTAHDAFNYMGRAYDIEVMGIQGVSTDSEAGLQDIRNLVGLLVERNVPAVFVESSVPDKNVRALIEGAAARGHTVVIGGTLYSDAMGAPGTEEGTYRGMILHNAQTIADALSGTLAPK